MGLSIGDWVTDPALLQAAIAAHRESRPMLLAAQRAPTDLGRSNIGELATRARGGCEGWFRDQGGSPMKAIPLSPETVTGAHSAGLLVYLKDLTGFDAIVETIAALLKVPSSLLTASIFAGRVPHRTPLHFDRNDNFTFQLEGVKRWRVTANVTTPAPLHNYIAGVEPEGEFALYFRPGSLGAADIFDLGPRSLLYVPRGWWHETETLSDSLALTITLHPVSWLEAVLPILRARLLTDPEWRRTCSLIDGGRQEPMSRLEAWQELHSRLANLVAGLSAADIAPISLPSATGGWLRDPTCALLLAKQGEGSFNLSVYFPGRAWCPTTSMNMTACLLPACKTLSIWPPDRLVTAPTVAAECGIPESRVSNLLISLAASGYLRSIQYAVAPPPE